MRGKPNGEAMGSGLRGCEMAYVFRQFAEWVGVFIVVIVLAAVTIVFGKMAEYVGYLAYDHPRKAFGFACYSIGVSSVIYGWLRITSRSNIKDNQK